MPNILTIRILKNIVISIVMLSAGIIFGMSSHSIYIASIPLLFGFLAAGACIKMYYDWKTGRIIVSTAVCIHKQPYFWGNAICIFTVTDVLSDKEYTFTLKNVKNSSFSVATTYDFLFDSRRNSLSEENLIDFAASDTPIGHLNE